MARCDPIRVMVVDDRADARLLMRAVLAEHTDLDVVAEADGAPAAIAALASNPDVALVDARMPYVSGFELAPQLLARAPGVRIVLVSAVVDDRMRADAASAGIEGCVVKGEWDALADAVRRVAGR